MANQLSNQLGTHPITEDPKDAKHQKDVMRSKMMIGEFSIGFRCILGTLENS
jgi:hypothetical protein